MNSGGLRRALVTGLVACLLPTLATAATALAHGGPLPDELLPRTGTSTAPGTTPPSPAAGCPTSTDEASFESSARLLAENRVMAELGRRPTGSRAQLRFIAFLERRLARIPGIRLGELPYVIDRWQARGATLRATDATGTSVRLPTSGTVPYAQATPGGGVAGRLLYVPPGTALSAQDLHGRIVVRDAVPGTVPYAAFRAVSWFEWDPDGTLLTDAPGSYERDFAGYDQRVTDLQDAGEGGAAALVFVHGFPRAQVQGQYAPYEGIHWRVPALYVGVDEGERLKTLAAAGGSAQVTLRAATVPSPSRTVIATLPGASDERMVIESHTDGMNAIWDNGPIAILALARHFAALPRECRPRTLQFVLTTGHLYQHLAGGADRGGGAELVAQQLDSDYDQGTLAMVFALEHLGAREFVAGRRPGGLPGRSLQPTGRRELNTLFVGESPVLIDAVDEEVVRHDLRRTFVMRGSDAPGASIPAHNSYGGEGTEYQQHLIPTIALVTGPWTLYNPAFGMEAIDGALMRRQALLFSDLLHRLAAQPTAALGGGYLGMRAARSLVCSSGLATLRLTRCEGDPYG